MNNDFNIYERYGRLLAEYSLSIKPGDRVFVKSTFLSEPLLRSFYRAAIQRGAHVVEFDLDFADKGKIYLDNANEDQLSSVSPVSKLRMETYDVYLVIRAPYNLRETQHVDASKASIRRKAMSEINATYFSRTATLDMRRSLCQFPTQAAAQNAGMSLEEYSNFIFTATKLYEDDPVQAWKDLSAQQQHIVDKLNNCSQVRYKANHMDISFSTNGRTWINSDGQTNMPSGEVYTSPVEDSVNGYIRFTYPGLYMGHEVQGVELEVKDGYIEKWSCEQGKDFLDRIFAMEGTRRFGEAAIGTNYDIQKMTRNILFDEKIGGTVHMAIGQSYKQCGGKNTSSVHWDMISDMTESGEIFADGEKIYEKGKFIL